MSKSAPSSPETFPFLVVANKVDLEDERKVSALEGRKFAQQNGNMLFYESSAKQNYNVEVAFKELGTLAIRRQMEAAEGQMEGTN